LKRREHVSAFLETIEREPLACFGAVATMLIERGFDMSGCLGKWLLDNPGELRWLTRQYMEAGCRILGAAGSQSGPWRLRNWGLQDRILELNSGVTRIIKEMLPRGYYVVGTILPTGKLLKPLGDLDREELGDAYREEVTGYVEGGADVIWVMTMMDIEEAVTAVKAAKEFSKLPVIASMAFDVTPKGARTMMGVDPKTAAIRLTEAGADIVGHNCGGATPQEVTRILNEIREVTAVPLVSRPNAGTPEVADGKTCWPFSPQQYAEEVPKWLAAGARIVGGCCGSTPEHAARISRVLQNSV
jgi:5-methyltetrahydrofolate--homocysteine methyltransferase